MVLPRELDSPYMNIHAEAIQRFLQKEPADFDSDTFLDYGNLLSPTCQNVL